MRNRRSAEWLALGAALLLVSTSWLVTGCGDEVTLVFFWDTVPSGYECRHVVGPLDLQQ